MSDSQSTADVSKLLQLQTAVAHGIPRSSIQPLTNSSDPPTTTSSASTSTSGSSEAASPVGTRCGRCQRTTPSPDASTVSTGACSWCAAKLEG